MLQSLRQIKRRIRSVDNTKKITQAMEMVSGAKLKRSESVLYTFRPYFAGLDSIVNNLLGSIKDIKHPLIEERVEKGKIALCVITSDTGLSGAYNDSVIRVGEQFIHRYGKAQVKLVAIGKKGFSYFQRRGFTVVDSCLGLHGIISDEAAERIVRVLTQLFLSKEADEVYIVYTQFISALKYRPIVEKFLNIEGAGKKVEEYLLEPGLEGILEELLPRYILSRIKFVLLNSFASEHSARMIAMKSAADNAQELIDSLTLLRNKARQALITKEVIEVSGAAQILKG